MSETSLLYITRVDIFLNSAQSLQIQKMSNSFSNLLNSFSLIFLSSEGHTEGNDTFMVPLHVNTKIKFLRYLIFYLRAFTYSFLQKYDIIFTRDIFIVLLCVLFRKKCVYEVHHDFETKIGVLIFKLCKDSPYVRLIFISDGARKGFQDLYHFKANYLVCHDGYDPRIFENIDICDKKFEECLQNYEIVFVHCGGFSSLKGATKIAEIVTTCDDICFVQIGDVTGPQKDRELLSQLISRPNFYFIRHLVNTDVGYYLKKASALFFPMDKNNPYWWCTSPLKLVEYVASGNLIFGSFEGSSRELIKNNLVVDFAPSSSVDMRAKLDVLRNKLKNKRSLRQNEISHIQTWDQRATHIAEFLNHEDK